MGGVYTPQVQEAVTRLGSRLSYGEAQEELERMWGIKISVGSVRGITLRNGLIANELIDARVEQLEKEAPTPEKEPKQLLMSADGAFIQLTSGEWREVKTVAFGEFEAKWDAKEKKVTIKTEDVSYFSRAAPADEFGRAALLEWQARGGDKAQRVVSVNDGAAWIQSFIDYHCPQAIRVLDFAHAKSYIAAIGKAIYGAESDTFPVWFAKMSKQLGKEPPQRTLSDLRLLFTQHAQHPLAAEMEHALRYLEKRKEMIDYPHYRKEQIPIGSGMVESAHKVVMQKRMKQAGMRWADENVNPMLALRMLLCNQRWDTGWQDIKQQQQQHKRQTRLDKITWQPSVEPSLTVSLEQLIASAERLQKKHKQPTPKEDHPWQKGKWPLRHRH